MIARQGRGYWDFVIATLALMFIIYITINGKLPEWLSLLSFTAKTAPQVGAASASAPSSATGGLTSPGTNVLGAGALGGAALGPLGALGGALGMVEKQSNVPVKQQITQFAGGTGLGAIGDLYNQAKKLFGGAP